MSAIVEERVAATERRWREEVQRTEADGVQAQLDFERASRRYQAACDSGDDEESGAAYNECMRALGRLDGMKRRLAQLEDPRELADRLTVSRKLAEKFGGRS